MANVLGTLFGDIAVAIRDMTGESPEIKMKPAEFPDKIRSIQGGGTGSSDGYIYKYGTFNATNTQMTVSHGLGKIPDIVIIWANCVPGSNCISTSVGFSSKMMKFFDEYAAKTTILMANGSAMSFGNSIGIEEDGIVESYGHIRNATTSTFDVGNNDANTALGKLYLNKQYNYIAICV